MLVARRVRIDLDARHHAVQPLPDRPIGIVVERVHARVLKAPVRLDPVPALPDCRRPHLDRVQPRGIGFLVHQFVRHVGVPVAAQHVAQIGRARKAGGEVVARLAHLFCQARRRPRAHLFRQHVKVQRQHIGRL